ncbi:hypothetical protein [Limosilactobacillus sp.]|uniref:hypothetical protein n=1 Tax=Limosilactobacillus sp. TaxID=2773925 RepID=UPI0025BB539C|nr:hypothetical protein [Limosilactobacillus sp.]MCH3921841.1 hypothetical protein [Limosilactobacillus sp.]MCH3928612.1 hypothetical protein [Limosilactobacillus sp.]
MRKSLKNIGAATRERFVGEFARTGYKRVYQTFKPTILLTNIRLLDTGELITNHLWFNYGKQFLCLGELRPGDQLAFNARVGTYYKGYCNAKSKDYRLQYPTKIELLTAPQKRPPMPLDNAPLIGYIMKQNKSFYLANNRPYDEWYIERYEHYFRTHLATSHASQT